MADPHNRHPDETPAGDPISGAGVDWRGLEERAVAENRPEVADNLRQLRSISRFNELVLGGENPLETMGPAGKSGESGDPAGHAAEPETPEFWHHLRLLRQLGRGAHAVVHLARDEKLQRDVALKLYLPTAQNSARETLPGAVSGTGTLRSPDNVLREGRLMARVRHPNVVAVHGAESDGDRVGIWMDHIRGRTLDQILADQGLLGAREATLIGLDLCQALAAVHACGLVHQDVKAQNVMREEGGRIVLMDFGIGVEIEDGVLRNGMQASGTPFYMAPEALLEGNTSIASDIYSLGVLLFHLVSQRFPVEADDMTGLLTAHRNQKRNRLRDLRPDLPKTFIDVVERALSVDPSERQGSMGDLENALAMSMGMQASNAKPLPGRRKIPWTPFAIVIAAFVLVFGIRQIMNRIYHGFNEDYGKAVQTFMRISGDNSERPVDHEGELIPEVGRVSRSLGPKINEISVDSPSLPAAEVSPSASDGGQAQNPWTIPQAPNVHLEPLSPEAREIHSLLIAEQFTAASHLINQSIGSHNADPAIPALRAMELMMNKIVMTSPMSWVVDDVLEDGRTAKPHIHAQRWLRETVERDPGLKIFVADVIMEAALYSMYRYGTLILDDRIFYTANGPGLQSGQFTLNQALLASHPLPEIFGVSNQDMAANTPVVLYGMNCPFQMINAMHAGLYLAVGGFYRTGVWGEMVLLANELDSGMVQRWDLSIGSVRNHYLDNAMYSSAVFLQGFFLGNEEGLNLLTNSLQPALEYGDDAAPVLLLIAFAYLTEEIQPEVHNRFQAGEAAVVRLVRGLHEACPAQTRLVLQYLGMD